MSRLDAFFGLVHTGGAQVKGFLDLGTPIASYTLSGPGMAVRQFTIPALADTPAQSDAVAAYSYMPSRGHFACLSLRIIGDGVLNGWAMVDTPTSTTNLAASGTYPRSREFEMSCQLPFVLNTSTTYIHPTASTEYGVTNSLPKILEPANWSGRLAAYVYSIVVWNPGDADVILEVIDAS